MDARPSARSSAWITTAPRAQARPLAAARNSGRVFRRSMGMGEASVRPSLLGGLGRQPLAALGAATRDDLLAVLGRHARTIAVTALAHESGRLIGALHGYGLQRIRRAKKSAVDTQPDRRCQPRGAAGGRAALFQHGRLH